MRPLRAAAQWLEDFPDTPAFCDRHLRQSWKQFLLLLLTGLFFRAVTFGDPNLHVDEAFYFLVGQEMHHGAIPYVDIWDRKPFGLFLIYYLIAGLSTSVLAYQIVAWLFAGATAMAICRIAARWSGIQGGLLAGVSYLAMLGPLEGFGGQTPVFYNLFVASAVLLVLDARAALDRGDPTWRSFAAMALAGLAITVKQTSLFESGFLGLYVAWHMIRSPAPPWRKAATIVACAALGALPTLAIAAAYFWIGDWSQWWQAMVLSNLAKVRPAAIDIAFNLAMIGLRLYPLLAVSGLGFLVADRRNPDTKDRVFLRLWIVAAIIGVVSVPNGYTHYALPLCVPLAATCGLALGRRDVGVFLAGMLALFTMVLFNPFARGDRALSIETMDRLAMNIVRHDTGGGLLVYDGPPLLYLLSYEHPPTRLAFPHHLNHRIEKNVSGLDTAAEVRRILRAKPGVVAVAAYPSNLPVNRETRERVMAYVENNCRIVDVGESYELHHPALIAIWGDCREGAPDLEIPDP